MPLRGYEDEKFCYVALRRGKRPEYELVTFGILVSQITSRSAHLLARVHLFKFPCDCAPGKLGHLMA